MTFPSNGIQLNDAFSGRPNISLRLNVSEAQVAGTNRSTISWSLQLVETASQPSFNLNANSTASLTFTLGSGVTLYSGDNTPAIAKYTYDFRATGNQTKTIGSGSFVVTHTDAGGGTITASATATDVGGNLGSASIPSNANSVWSLIDLDTTPNTPSTPSVTQNGNGSFTISLTNPGTANGGPATSIYYQVYNATTATWDFTLRAAGSISLTPTNQYIFRAVAVNNQATEYSTNTSQYAGVPSLPTGISATESSTQSRDVAIAWTVGANNGSAITSQTLVWGTDPTLTTTVGSQVFNDGTTSSYTILNNRSTGYLFPNTTYYYKITTTNAIGSNGTTIYSFTTRASSPFVSPTANTAPNTRSTTKVWDGTSFVTASVRVYDGTTPYNISGWKYLK